MSTDGLAAMRKTREEASARGKKNASARHAPPPRHPAKVRPPVADPVTDVAPTTDAVESTVVTDPVQAPPTAAPAVTTPGADAVVPLVRSTIYLDEHASTWLEDIAIAGRRARPKVDASRSAVVRLALERLMATTTVDEVVAELQGRSERVSDQVGRKRL